MSVDICVYWGPRQQPVETLVAQVATYFRILAQIDDRLARWAPKGPSSRRAMSSEAVDTASPEVLRGFLLKGQNKTDMPPRQPIPELGYSLSFWNQRCGNLEAACTVHCGAYSDYLSQDGQNSALLELTFLNEAHVAAPVLLDVLIKAIDIWRPDWGTIWRYVNAGHPDGAPWDRRHVQYAFYQSQGGVGPTGRDIGRRQVLGAQGSLWINDTVAPLMETA